MLAAVNGPAAGAGLSLALACDVRIASERASFVPAFSGIGLVPDSGGTWLARRLLGQARAFEWLSTGRKLSAAEALEWGLVSEVVPEDAFAERAREIAQRWASLPTRAVWETKRLLDAAETATFEEQLEREAEHAGRADAHARLRRGGRRVSREAPARLHRRGLRAKPASSSAAARRT